jgi:hypothetical protein
MQNNDGHLECGQNVTFCGCGQIVLWAMKYRKPKLEIWGIRRREKPRAVIMSYCPFQVEYLSYSLDSIHSDY